MCTAPASAARRSYASCARAHVIRKIRGAVDPVRASVTVDRPREEVFDYLADIANHAEFMGPLFEDWRLTRVDSYGAGAGARFRSNARMDRFGWGDINFVTVEPPRRIVGIGRGGKYNR